MYPNEAQGLEVPSTGYNSPMRIKPATIRQELLGTIAHLKEQLEKKEAMVKLLDSNPAIEQFMDLSRG